jgi:hypothetical protein
MNQPEIISDTISDKLIEDKEIVEAAVEAPVEAAVETPVEAPVEAAVETPVESMIEAPVEAPVESTIEAPVEETSNIESTIDEETSNIETQPNQMIEQKSTDNYDRDENSKYHEIMNKVIKVKNHYTRKSRMMKNKKMEVEETEDIKEDLRKEISNTLIDLIKLSKHKHMYKTHHNQLDRTRNKFNNYLNNLSKKAKSKKEKNKTEKRKL